MLATISHAISAENSDVVSCQLRTDEDGDTGCASLTVVVLDAAHLQRVLDRLEGLKGMIEVERRSGRGRVSRLMSV